MKKLVAKIAIVAAAIMLVGGGLLFVAPENVSATNPIKNIGTDGGGPYTNCPTGPKACFEGSN